MSRVELSWDSEWKCRVYQVDHRDRDNPGNQNSPKNQLQKWEDYSEAGGKWYPERGKESELGRFNKK